MNTYQSTLEESTDTDHPPIPDGLPYTRWEDIPQIVRNNICASDGVVRESFADYAVKQLGGEHR